MVLVTPAKKLSWLMTMVGTKAKFRKRTPNNLTTLSYNMKFKVNVMLP